MTAVNFSPRQNEILSTLSRVILAEGFEQMTVAALADRLRCSRRTLYTLAPSRDVLVVGVVTELFDGWLQRAHAAAADADDGVGAVVGFLTAGLDFGEASSVFLADVRGHPETAAVHGRFKREYMGGLTRLVEDVAHRSGAPKVEAETAAEILAAAVRRLAELSHGSCPTLDATAAAAVVDDLVRAWLRPAAS